ncbi:MAG: hypothetical protein LLG04_03695 [Parachlamydia sp.]|nr:hypothetical protein [Parachlamydia sp.]
MSAVSNVNFATNWDFPAVSRREESDVQCCAHRSIRNSRYSSSHTFRCTDNVSFIEAYPITTLFLTVMTGGLAIFPLVFMRTDVVERCNFHGHDIRQERVPFMQQHPLTSLFLIAVTGGLALLFLPFATCTLNRCQQGHLMKHVQKVPFVIEYPITSIFMACLSGGIAIIPLIFMTATRSFS